MPITIKRQVESTMIYDYNYANKCNICMVIPMVGVIAIMVGLGGAILAYILYKKRTYSPLHV